jgi:hypothetical protein
LSKLFDDGRKESHITGIAGIDARTNLALKGYALSGAKWVL